MELIADKNCFIAPTKREARAMARMLQSQGDMRAIIDEQDTLIVFDSYGNTHTSARNKLGLRYLNDCLIFRLDGGVYTERALPRNRVALERAFAPEHCEVIRAIYAHLDETITPYATAS